MRFAKCLTFLVFALTAFASHSKTLIVTHPETLFDPFRVAGSATRQLLENPAFKNKIVLYSYKTNPITKKPNSYTFSTSGLKFRSRQSENGITNLRLAGAEFYVAGGYWDACLSNTIEELINTSDSSLDIDIHVMMKAVFTPDGELENPDHEKGIHRLFRSLDEVLQRDPDVFLESQVMPVARSFRFSPGKLESVVDFILDGNTLAIFGQGPRKVRIIFERDLDPK